jgi:hypothetical protein
LFSNTATKLLNMIKKLLVIYTFCLTLVAYVNADTPPQKFSNDCIEAANRLGMTVSEEYEHGNGRWAQHGHIIWFSSKKGKRTVGLTSICSGGCDWAKVGFLFPAGSAKISQKEQKALLACLKADQYSPSSLFDTLARLPFIEESQSCNNESNLFNIPTTIPEDPFVVAYESRTFSVIETARPVSQRRSYRPSQGDTIDESAGVSGFELTCPCYDVFNGDNFYKIQGGSEEVISTFEKGNMFPDNWELWSNYARNPSYYIGFKFGTQKVLWIGSYFGIVQPIGNFEGKWWFITSHNDNQMYRRLLRVDMETLKLQWLEVKNLYDIKFDKNSNKLISRDQNKSVIPISLKIIEEASASPCVPHAIH